MAKKGTMDFEWNYKQAALVKRMGFDAEAQKYFVESLLKYAEPLTPYGPEVETKRGNIDGHMRDNYDIIYGNDEAQVEYKHSYAHYQYFADDSSWNRYTAGTQSGWLEEAWNTYRAQITGSVGGKIGARSRRNKK